MTTEYTIVIGISPTELVTKVNEHIKQGWQPIGGVCIATAKTLGDKTTTVSCQSMTK